MAPLSKQFARNLRDPSALISSAPKIDFARLLAPIDARNGAGSGHGRQTHYPIALNSCRQCSHQSCC